MRVFDRTRNCLQSKELSLIFVIADKHMVETVGLLSSLPFICEGVVFETRLPQNE